MTSGGFGSGGFGASAFGASPFYTSKGLIDSALRSTNHRDPAADTQRRLVALDLLNARYLQILKGRDWRFLYKTFFKDIEPKKNGGSITLTLNSKTVAGSGTAFDANDIGQYLIPSSGDSNRYLIDGVAGPESLTLRNEYSDATASGSDYNIVYPFYLMPEDLHQVRSVSIDEVGELNLTSQQDLRNISQFNPTHYGSPRHCALISSDGDDRKMLELYPAPEEKMVMQIDYKMSATKLEDSDDCIPLIPDAHRDVLFFALVADIYRFLDDDTNSLRYESKAKESYALMVNDREMQQSMIKMLPGRNHRVISRHTRYYAGRRRYGSGNFNED